MTEHIQDNTYLGQKGYTIPKKFDIRGNKQNTRFDSKSIFT